MVRQSIPMSHDNSRRPPLRCKTFTGMRQHQLILQTLAKLQQSGFYWGAINGREAQALLEGQAVGAFLLRDSSDAHHFFTLSVRTQRGTKNLRVQCDSASFWLESDPHSQTQPRFDCILKMVQHYMPPHGDAQAPVPPSCYICCSDAGKVPLLLRRPLTCGLTSLKHLCRKTVNGHQGACTERQQLPLTIQEFLGEYDASI
ncbi:suppressor of cytokine signaling 3a [Engraulis encrasicolus]|uniref:suppressor of cytokine signaling 3a n=1 Tax=Engraulis encrasicolus TaxID=184585 RepID=UPI002FD155BB